jgi:(2R)-ethylmalonyl-CoA mutase
MNETQAQVPSAAPQDARPAKDRPWVMRTYAGHSTAAASNALYRTNLAKGQTGLSVAFDLPTQTGYDPDSPLSRGEVGKVGVPVPHLGEMRKLFDEIPLTGMNTSMTINATAMWLLALYQVTAEEQNGLTADSSPEERSAVAHQLAGTTQNDIIKEYLSRGTYVFPPEHSLRLISDMIAYTVHEIPKWNPINICSYHLQEAGATPTQELAYALCTAIAVLDQVRASGQVDEADFEKVVGRISFFVNAGVRFVEETCKMRAFVQLWDEITRERYGVQDEKMRRFRYGVQVNSLGLTEAQPENNVQRIVLEMLGVTLSKNARARRAAPGVERGPRPPAAVGPAVVAAPAAGPGLRVRPAGVRRHLRRLPRDRGQGRRARRGREGRDRPRPGARRGDRGRRVGLHEAGAGERPRRPPRADRER